MLIGLRFVQGLAGAGGIVIARAVVRDLHSGAAAVAAVLVADAGHRARRRSSRRWSAGRCWR